MRKYKKGNFLLLSDFEIRPFMEEGPDIDLLIPINHRTLNLYIDQMPSFIDNRFQLLDIRNILIRFSTIEENNMCTIHFLRNIDLRSAVLNLVWDYTDHYIKVKKLEYSAEILIEPSP